MKQSLYLSFFLIAMSFAAAVRAEDGLRSMVAEITSAQRLLVLEEGVPEVSGEVFAQGSWNLQIYGGAGIGDTAGGEIYTFHVGGGYHLLDRFSINLVGLVGGVDASRDDSGAVIGLDLLFRWHFLVGEGGNWSIYMDFGVGLQQASTDYPDDSHFNFRPQAGLGATVKLSEDIMLMGGVRWLHISNAGISERNDGVDTVFIYMGVMIPF